jgi:hypothetical protein
MIQPWRGMDAAFFPSSSSYDGTGGRSSICSCAVPPSDHIACILLANYGPVNDIFMTSHEMVGQSLSKTIGRRCESVLAPQHRKRARLRPPANSGFIRSLCVVIFASVHQCPYSPAPTHRTMATMHTSPRPLCRCRCYRGRHTY